MYGKVKRDAVRGMGWAFFSSTMVRVLQIITTGTLAKLLMPADFGIFSLATIITQAMLILPNIGFAQAPIYRQDESKKYADTAFILSTATSVGLGILLALGAPLMGDLFDEPALVAPSRVMAFALAISGMTAVPLALMDKELAFRRRAVPEVAGALVYAAVSISMAVAGYGVWSMVIGWTAMWVATAAAVWAVSPWRPGLQFCREGSRVIVSYGKNLVVATLAAFLFLQIDNASVGKWLGVTALGFYSLTFTICNIPATNMTAVVNRVMFPTYSKLEGNVPEIGGVYLKTIKHISSVSFLAAAALVVISEPALRALYGQKWVDAIPLFHVLALYGLIRSIGGTSESIFMAVGKTWMVQRVSLTKLIIGASLVYPVAIHYGLMGVAILFTLAYFTGTTYGVVNVLKTLRIRPGDWLRSVRASALSGVLGGIGAWLTVRGLGESLWSAMILGSVVLIGIYGIAMFLLDREGYGEIKGILSKSAVRDT